MIVINLREASEHPQYVCRMLFSPHTSGKILLVEKKNWNLHKTFSFFFGRHLTQIHNQHIKMYAIHKQACLMHFFSLSLSHWLWNSNYFLIKQITLNSLFCILYAAYRRLLSQIQFLCNLTVYINVELLSTNIWHDKYVGVKLACDDLVYFSNISQKCLK